MVDTSRKSRMSRLPKKMVFVAFALLCASIVASVMWRVPSMTDYFPLFFGVHIAIVVLGIWAVFRIWRLKSSWSELLSAFRPYSFKLIVIGVLVAVAAAISGSNVEFDMGTLPDGTAIYSKSWSERDGKFWLSVNKRPAVQISEVQYRDLQRESYAIFSTVWVVLSYLIFLQWYYIARREAEKNEV